MSVRAQGLPSVDYYAPDYRVEIEGQELDPESKGDVLSLKVTMDLDNMTSFEMSINNWDDRKIDFKYSDTNIFDVGNDVHVMMGYADALLSMARGQISSLTPRFPESGASTLTVRGLDGMFKLRDRKPDEGEETKYVDKADWQIAQAVADRNGLSANVTREGPVHELVVQKNQDDAQFIMERAKRIDFDAYIQTDPDSGDAVLHFVKPTDGRSAASTRVYTLEWGRNLINFSPTIDLSHQVGKITVRGWDPSTKSPIVATAEPGSLPGSSNGGQSGPAIASDKCRGKKDVVVDSLVTSQEEADDLAASLLAERAYDFIKGSGQVIGLADLRPGDNLELLGLGQRFSGTYYVKKVEHALGSSGYRTNFEVRKVYDGGLVS